MTRSRLLALATLLVVATMGSGARASEQTDLEKGRAAYLGRQYDEADTRFQAMLAPKTGTLRDPVLVTQARMYWGAVKVAKGHADEAVPIFETLILADPAFDPDPLSFPTNVIDLFIDVRAKLRDKINAEAQAAARREAERKAREEEERRRERERVAMLERLAAEEKVTEVHSRWIAMVPFGVGQFQNGQKALGWGFLISEAVLLAGTAVTLPIYTAQLQNRSEAYAAGDTFRANEYIDRANTVRTVNLVLVAGFIAAATVGIAQAQINYVPDKVEIRPRAIPRVGLAPVLAPAAGGGFVGVGGRF